MLNTQTINAIGIFGFFVGDDGKPVKNTKINAPYNYDDFILWDDGSGDGNPENFKNHSGAYSDRMMQ